MQTTPQELIEKYTAKGWWGDLTLTSLFKEAVAETPDRDALVDPANRPDLIGGKPKRFTYAELDAAVEALAAGLYAHGVRAEDIVVVQLPNVAELALAYLALARLGAIVSPVPVQYGRHELSRIRDILGASAFLSLHNFKGQDALAERGPAFEGCTLFALAVRREEFKLSRHLTTPSPTENHLGKE